MVMFLVTQLDSPVALVFVYTWFYRYNPLIDLVQGPDPFFPDPLAGFETNPDWSAAPRVAAK